jgi:hypothetical protein
MRGRSHGPAINPNEVCVSRGRAFGIGNGLGLRFGADRASHNSSAGCASDTLPFGAAIEVVRLPSASKPPSTSGHPAPSVGPSGRPSSAVAGINVGGRADFLRSS